MFNKDHCRNPTVPVGLILGKLALKVAGHLIKKKITERLASKSAARELERERQGAAGAGGRRFGAA